MRWFGKKKDDSSPEERCDKCNSRIAKAVVRDNTYKICRKCTRVIISDIPNSKFESLMSVIVGRVLNVPDKDGLTRINVEYPQEKRGIANVRTFPRVTGRSLYATSPQLTITLDGAKFRISCYNPSPFLIKRGDKVAFAGIYAEHGFFYPLHYRNLSMGDLGGAFTSGTISAPELEFMFQRETRLHIVAEQVLSKVIGAYNSKLSEGVQEPLVRKGARFEEIVIQLFVKMGFEGVYRSGGASDKGIDIECFQKDDLGIKRIIVQCKHQSLLNKIKPTQVRDFAHVIAREKEKEPTIGYFITSSYFSPECYLEENCGKDMELIDHDHLHKLLKRYNMSMDE